jgi:inhibitor of KinA sporulation pathway (predicted exonuclease)
LDVVLKQVDDFLESNELLSKYSFRFVTDGPWDFRDFLDLECKLKNIPRKSYYDDWVNIRSLFGKFYKVKPVGIKKMVNILNIEYSGTAHQGIDDARNIANIGIHMMKDGCVLRSNGSLNVLKKK